MTPTLFDRRDTTYLRGLAIIIIVIHHVYQFTCNKYGVNYPSYASLILGNLGNLGCAVFFLLSGYGLTCSVIKSTPISFAYFYKHLIKLISPFLFIWLIDSFCIHYAEGISITNLLTLSISTNKYWFLKEIFLIYVIFFIPNFIERRHDTLLIILPATFAISIVLLRFDRWWWNTTFCFPLGVACSLYYTQLTSLYNNYKRELIISFILLFIIFFWLSYYSGYFEILRSLSFATLTVMIVPYRKHNIKLLDYCSKESLKIYIFHIFLLQFNIIQSPIVYSAMIIVGTFMLIGIYNMVTRLFSFI